MIRVGRRQYINGKPVDPNFPGFTPILCLTPSTKYGKLGPYCLEKDGQILENIWQFSKVYKFVPAVCERYSRYDQTIIWKNPAQNHLDENDNLTQNYLEWREKGMNNKYAVRYPVGYKFRNKCLFSLKTLDGPRLDYIDARKQIYLPLYLELVKNCPQFLELKGRLANGENLLIIEVDGPHQESLNYYKSKYGVNDDFIISNTIVVNKENMNVMLNDPKHSFGHGYCLGIALFENLIKDS